MTTPGAEDASPSPEYSGDPDGSDMAAEQKLDYQSDASSSAQSGTGQKPLNAKDPQRPRRKKAKRACLACQRAHLTCSEWFNFLMSWSEWLTLQVTNDHVHDA